MIKTNSVEGIEQCEATLNFVGLNHCLKQIIDGQFLASASQKIRYG
jgi:hypothetical protein